MRFYNQKVFSARQIAGSISNGCDVLIWNNSWEPIPSADSFQCAVGFNGERIYPKAKIRSLDYSHLSRNQTYLAIKNTLNNIFRR